MATLTGTQIKNTYDSLLKIEDNDGISSTSKLITDGLGNATPLSMSTSQVSSSVDIQASSFSTPTGLATEALMANGTTASLPSGNQILDWTVAIPGSVIHNSNIANLYTGFRVTNGSSVIGTIGNGMAISFRDGINTKVNVVDNISSSNSVVVEYNAESTDWDSAYTHSQAAHAPSNAEQNVQSDWSAVIGDAVILNKPTIPSGNSIIDWTVAQPGGNVIHASNYTSGSGSLSGGTNDYVPLWNGTTALDSSVIAQSGSKIGIGESSPSETLVVREGTSNSSIKVLTYSNTVGAESSIKFASVASGANYVKGGIAFKRTLSAGRGDIHFLNDNNTDNGGVNTTDDTKMIIKSDGDVGIGTTDPKSKLQVVGLSSYTDNAAAISGGLTVGAFYHTSGALKVVI